MKYKSAKQNDCTDRVNGCRRRDKLRKSVSIATGNFCHNGHGVSPSDTIRPPWVQVYDNRLPRLTQWNIR